MKFISKKNKPRNIKYKQSTGRINRKLVIAILSGVLLVAMGFLTLQSVNIFNALSTWNKTTMFVNPEKSPPPPEVEKENKYTLNPDIVTILLLGIDRGDHNINKGYNNQCDAVAVIALDTVKNTMKILSIPRETMTPVIRKDTKGNFADEITAQIAISHAYGTDDASSVELTQMAVSKLLYGVPIFKTAKLEVLGVPKANDLLGGVTIELLQDFTNISDKGRRDPVMKKGETIKLTGKQAYTYVQYRDVNIENSSVDRFKRQIQYFKAYFKQAKEKTKENPTFPVTAYMAMNEYVYTNMTLEEIAFFASKSLSINIDDNVIIPIEGEMKQGEKFSEFYADEEKLKQLVLDVFFIQE